MCLQLLATPSPQRRNPTPVRTWERRRRSIEGRMVILIGLDFADIQSFGFAVRRFGALPRLRKVAASETRELRNSTFASPGSSPMKLMQLIRDATIYSPRVVRPDGSE